MNQFQWTAMQFQAKPMQNLLPLSLFCVLSNVALRRYTHTMTTDRCTPFTHQCAYTYITQKLYVSNWSFIALLLLHVMRAWASYITHMYICIHLLLLLLLLRLLFYNVCRIRLVSPFILVSHFLALIGDDM